MFNQFDYVALPSWTLACSFMASHPTAMIYAGGTDILVRCREGRLLPSHLVDIKGLPGATAMAQAEDGSIVIGAATPLNAIERFLKGKAGYEALVQAAHVVGSWQIRNRASLGGNICNASPAADTAPALLVLEATLLLVGPSGERILPIGEFFLAPGKTALLPGEILRSIVLPAQTQATVSIYLKAARTKAVDLAQVGVALLMLPDKNVRVALGAVAPVPLLAWSGRHSAPPANWTTEETERLVSVVEQMAAPITDLRATADYRRHMVGVLLRRAVEQATLLHQERGEGR
ncbi:MAG: Carbon monoxide dehydrogenase medium chain [Firmicutes bacterium]|nr:Carbon monoxide dehydrogenase medium chain [Bacillota bacterium]